MLFYTTEGVFGTESFKIIAEEVFPLDIGTSTYTEYETDDPDFLKWLWENKQCLEMQKGHCHSHNNMTTFFSGTDDDELRINAPNHNIYVSLIVNNKNINCAKIAFIATEKTTIPGRKLVTEVSFANEKGEPISKQYTTTYEDEVKEVKVMYTQECEIEYPSTVGGAITARFRQLLERITKKEEERRKTYQQNTSRYSGYYDGQPSGYNRGGKWNQPDLFDTRSGPNRQDEKTSKKDRDKNNVGADNRRRVLLIPQSVSGKNLLSYIEGTNKKPKGAPMSSIYTQLPKSTKSEIYNMLGKLVALDLTSEEHLSKVMNITNLKYYPQGARTQEMRIDANFFYDQMGRAARRFYGNTFTEDVNMTKYEDTMMVCVEILSSFDTHFPELTENLIEVIKSTFKK